VSKGKFSELLTEAKSPKAKNRTVEQGNSASASPDLAADVEEGAKAVRGSFGDDPAAWATLDSLFGPRAGEAEVGVRVEESQIVPAKKGAGRPRGKRSDGNYEQVTLFMRRELRKELRRLLLDDDKLAGLDLSDLVDKILSSWIEVHKASKYSQQTGRGS
jgi:hypothetical protein